MELRHLRYFLAVSEELHFARAAERLNIEQSPLSRTIKELESEFGTLLFERNSRGTRLTWPGQVLTEDARRIFTAIDQARANVQAAASGYRGMLRIALSDGIVAQRLAALLAQSAWLAATRAAQSSGGLPRPSIFSNTAYGSDLLPDDRRVCSSLTQAYTMTFALESYRKNSRYRLPSLARRQ